MQELTTHEVSNHQPRIRALARRGCIPREQASVILWFIYLQSI